MKVVSKLSLFLLAALTVYAAQDAVSAVEASVKGVDRTAKTVTVKAADGTEHTFHVVQGTVVHGGAISADAAKDSFHGLHEGGDVVVHYTKRGSEETAREIDRLGDDGLKESKGTISKLDRGGKTLVVKGDDGVESTYRLSDHAAHDAGKDVADATAKSAKVTVYYSEEGGRKVAHFFKTIA